MTKVLVLGASGYLGGFAVRRLRQTCELTLGDVVGPESEFADLAFRHTDVTQYADVQSACAGQDAVVNLVALVRGRHAKPASVFCDVMVKGLWHVAQACVEAGVERLVSVSSVIACGGMPSVEQPYHVGDPMQFGPGDLFYCLSKHLAEEIGLAYHQAHGLKVIHLRPGVIAGDGSNPGPGDPPETPRPWFVYVDPRDVAQAVELAVAAQHIDYGCYNIVAGRADSVFDWSEAARELGYNPEFNWPEIAQKRAP